MTTDLRRVVAGFALLALIALAGCTTSDPRADEATGDDHARDNQGDSDEDAYASREARAAPGAGALASLTGLGGAAVAYLRRRKG